MSDYVERLFDLGGRLSEKAYLHVILKRGIVILNGRSDFVHNEKLP